MSAPICPGCGEPMYDTNEVARHWYGRRYAETTLWACDECGTVADEYDLDREAKQADRDEYDNRRIDEYRDRELERRYGCEE